MMKHANIFERMSQNVHRIWWIHCMELHSLRGQLVLGDLQRPALT